jgi:hypothetical protein
MTDEMIALARRAVACPKWRWMPGMLWVVSRVAFLEDYAGRIVEGACCAPFGPGLPDLRDPATLGCLLALVREAWKAPKANISWVTDDKCMVVFDTGHAQKFLLEDTEAEALVAALESAP